jgi:F0F1-type ATP synthase assembly protein I
MKWLDSVFLLKDEKSKGTGPSWNFRRKLIFGSYRVGVVMIAFGMLTFVWDRQVSVQMVVGGVALISIILTAYTASATFEDVRLYKETDGDESC